MDYSINMNEDSSIEKIDNNHCYGYTPIHNRILIECKIVASQLAYVNDKVKDNGEEILTVIKISDELKGCPVKVGDRVDIPIHATGKHFVGNYICPNYRKGKPDILTVIESVRDANKNRIKLDDKIESYVWFTVPVFDIIGIIH